MQAPTLLNSKGHPIVLNETDKHNSLWMARTLYNQHGPKGALKNALSYEVAITTLTTVTRKVSEQKFYTVRPSDYYPIVAGEGQWSTNLETFRSFDIADSFESGIVDTGGNNDRLSSADSAIDALNLKIFGWAKSLSYTIMDLEYASKSGNWDLVASKERSRKRNFDLGIQRIAFLGANGENGSTGACLGLLNQPGITIDTTTITAALSGLSPANLSIFQQTAIKKYMANNNNTQMPNRFVVPLSDFLGMAAQASSSFPIKTIYDLLLDGFKMITGNADFKILPVAYADASIAGSGVLPAGANTSVYALYNADEESIRMNVPLPYTTSLSNSINNFQFQNVGYAQFTGALALRPLELYYMVY